MPSSIDILSEAIQILGPPVKIEEHRGWAIWWCPFHQDAARSGKSKRANFGINFATDGGYWKCLRCGAHGPNLKKLRQQLGVYQPPPVVTEVVQAQPQVSQLDEALVEARSALRQSKAWDYLITERQVLPQIILMYGLGYGLSRPQVHLETLKAAQYSKLVSRKGWWLWAQGVVYAEPLSSPSAIQVRHRREDARNKYQTWGRQLIPYGSWRIADQTETLVSVEGMLDMLIFAQALEERARSPATLVRGEPVPDFVLADYPDLVPFEKQATNEQAQALLQAAAALVPEMTDEDASLDIPNGSLTVLYPNQFTSELLWTGDTRTFNQTGRESLLRAFAYLHGIAAYVREQLGYQVLSVSKAFDASTQVLVSDQQVEDSYYETNLNLWGEVAFSLGDHHTAGCHGLDRSGLLRRPGLAR